MLPNIVSQLVVVLKDTALGGLLLINFTVSQLARLLELRLRRGRRHVQRAPMPGNTPV